MPFINVKANIPISDSAEQAMKRQLGQAIEALPGKTEAWLMVNFEPEARLWFAGSDDAAAMVRLWQRGGRGRRRPYRARVRRDSGRTGHCRKPHLCQICRDASMGLEWCKFLIFPQEC